ncbi:hypothetical protein [Streptomyces sp. NPDC005953]|uniref:hypothetical protein n=1 Tax=Streptomyces sp. NPDC005953 TaxID=3156719 RepID=UPI0033E708B6
MTLDFVTQILPLALLLGGIPTAAAWWMARERGRERRRGNQAEDARDARNHALAYLVHAAGLSTADISGQRPSILPPDLLTALQETRFLSHLLAVEHYIATTEHTTNPPEPRT